MKYAILLFVSLSLGHLAHAEKLIASELLEKSKASDWRTLNPENVLYMEIPGGRVVIELNPAFAPHTVENIKKLAKQKYWDGLAIVRVQDNYVVQWADPNAENPAAKKSTGNLKATLEAEFDRTLDTHVPFTAMPDQDVYAPETGFSDGFAVARDQGAKKMWMIHCYGAIGVGRDNAANSGNGSELYAVIGNAPRHLDRNVTVAGRVVQGIELLSSLPRGHGKLGFYEKPEQPIPIRSVRLASDVPKKERTALEILKTDTPLFHQLIDARRNRSEDWFLTKAGHIDVCNMAVPSRMPKD